MELPVHSIFNSLSGEVGLVPQGTPVTFLRLAGCNLACEWCDTKETQQVGNAAWLDLNKIVATILEYSRNLSPRRVLVITGGEPLLYSNQGLVTLCAFLKTHGYQIMVETNGTIAPDIPAVDYWIVDWKVRDADKMISVFNYASLEKGVIKAVVTDRGEYRKAVKFFHNVQEVCKKEFKKEPPLFAVSGLVDSDDLPLATLAQWVIAEPGINIMLNVQLHKLIGVA